MNALRTYSPRFIMFDVDGTLVDTMPAFADLAADVMAKHFGDDKQEAREKYLTTSGIPFIHQLGIIHPDNIKNKAASQEFEHRKKSICNRTPINSETKEALYQLKNRGFGLIVSSNTGQQFVDDFVEREGFPFDLALGFDPKLGLAKGKPHVEYTLREFYLQSNELVFVGDSLKDGQLAAECGVPFIGRVGTFSKTSFLREFRDIMVIENITELLEILKICK